MDKGRISGTLKAFQALILFAALFVASASASAQDGEKLFKQNCASCHKVDDTKLVGPGLKGVFDRVPQPAEAWLLKWVKNSSAMIASGDAYAVKIFNENNKSQMTAFEYLSDDEIKAILSYVKAPPAPVAATPVEGTSVATGPNATDAMSDDTLLMVLGVIAILLLILVAVLGSVGGSLQALVNDKNGLPAPERYPFSLGRVMSKNKGLTAIAVLFLILAGGKAGYDLLMGVGVYQGYRPEQPINFSHKIHAGQNGINCVYCHTAAEKGKNAGIPSLNVCMNCHTYVDQGPSGKGEIAKIYAALDFDPATKTYGPNTKPVKWVRIHNLPDLAYFNHSQHVVVGKIECQKCHGEVQDEAVLAQNAPLTMGWCINCHRETSVQTADNAYYDDFIKRHKGKLDGEAITVDKIGGLECAKCHH